MRILVVGGYGFIGHRVVIKLLERGHEICIVDSMDMHIDAKESTWLYANRMEAINNAGKYKAVPHSFHSVEVFRTLRKFEPEVVIFLAGPPNQRYMDRYPIQGMRSLSTDLYAFLEKCDNVRRFVYISSSMVYGNFSTPVKETDKLEPMGLYATTKLGGEGYVKSYSKKNNNEYTIIRPSAVYGPWDNSERVVNKFILNALRDNDLVVNGESELLDFTYVDDVAEGIVLASLSSRAKNKTYNITRGYGRSIHEAAQLIVDAVGSGKVVIKEKDSDMPSRTSLNIDKAMIDLDYNPVVDIEQGFKFCYDWMIKSPYYLGNWE